MTFWCVVPIASSLANDLGLYDGLSESLNRSLMWGVPYLMGRLYLSSLAALRELAVAILLGAAIYAPLCLWEIRMSPTLSADFFGIQTYGGIAFAADLGKWGSRPVVFLQHPLALGLFLTGATLCGFGLIWSRSLKSIFGVPTSWLTGAVLVITLLAKNLGAIALLLVGIVSLFLLTRTRVRWPLLLLMLVAPIYVIARSTGSWSGAQITELAGAIHDSKAQSYAFRVANENILIEKALQHPYLGWGGWNRSRVFDPESGADVSITDGLWVIALGCNGFVGLVSVFLALQFPAYFALRRLGRRWTTQPRLALALAFIVLLTLYAIDCLPNSFVQPGFLLALGGLADLHLPGPAPSSVSLPHESRPARNLE